MPTPEPVILPTSPLKMLVVALPKTLGPIIEKAALPTANIITIIMDAVKV